MSFDQSEPAMALRRLEVAGGHGVGRQQLGGEAHGGLPAARTGRADEEVGVDWVGQGSPQQLDRGRLAEHGIECVSHGRRGPAGR
jgi:hypothetical protein